MADDPELLDLAVESGCFHMYIGVESVNSASLRGVNKRFNRVSNYDKSMAALNSKGIHVEASMILGFDEDGWDIFGQTLDFLTRNKCSFACVYVLTPLPGTKLFRTMEADGRLLHRAWSKYTYTSPVFRPKLLEAEQLENGLWHIYDNFYSLGSICRRLLFPPKKSVLLALARSMEYRDNIRRRVHPMVG